MAARGGHEAVVRLLLEYKAIANTKDEYYGRTALHDAANGHVAVIRLLLAHKMNINQETVDEEEVPQQLKHKVEVKAGDKYGKTALDSAAEREHETVVRLLQFR